MKKRDIIGGNNVAINKSLRIQLLLMSWVPLFSTLWNKFSAYEGTDWGWIDFTKNLGMQENGLPTWELVNVLVLYFSIMLAVRKTVKFLKWRVSDIIRVSEPLRHTFRRQEVVAKDIKQEIKEHILMVKDRVNKQGANWTRTMAISCMRDKIKDTEGAKELIKLEYSDNPLILLNELEVI